MAGSGSRWAVSGRGMRGRPAAPDLGCAGRGTAGVPAPARGFADVGSPPARGALQCAARSRASRTATGSSPRSSRGTPCGSACDHGRGCAAGCGRGGCGAGCGRSDGCDDGYGHPRAGCGAGDAALPPWTASSPPSARRPERPPPRPEACDGSRLARRSPPLRGRRSTRARTRFDGLLVRCSAPLRPFLLVEAPPPDQPTCRIACKRGPLDTLWGKNETSTHDHLIVKNCYQEKRSPPPVIAARTRFPSALSRRSGRGASPASSR